MSWILKYAVDRGWLPGCEHCDAEGWYLYRNGHYLGYVKCENCHGRGVDLERCTSNVKGTKKIQDPEKRRKANSKRRKAKKVD